MAPTTDEREPDDIIVGRNPVREALRAGRAIERIFIGKGPVGGLKALADEARQHGVVIQETDPRQLDRLAQGQVHQGIAAVVAPVAYARLDDVLAEAERRKEDPLLLVLDEVQDPHNLGSLLRSADGAGVHGVIVPNRRAAGLTMTVARTSAGAVNYVPVVQVSNIVRTLKQLKELNIWVAGADMGGAQDYWDAQLAGPLALVVGGEDKGLGRLVRETCDFVLRIPVSGKVNSLNAGVAGALLMFEVKRQRRSANGNTPGKG